MRCAHTVHAHTKLALSGLTCRRAQPDKRLTSRSIVYMGFPLADIAGSVFRKWSGFKGHILSACPVLHARTVAPAATTTEDAALADTVPGSAEQSAAGPAPNTVLSASASLSPKPPQDETPNEIPENPSPMQTSTLEQGPDSTTATVLAPPEPPPPEPPALPLSRQVEVLQTCQTGWVDFAESHGEQLKYYCVICGQWCAPAAGSLKSHMRRSHPTQWTMDKDIMNELKLHHRLKYRGVCKACGFQPTGAQKGALHTPKCVAYYQACILHKLSSNPPGHRTHMATSGQQEVLELFGKHLPSVAAQATTQEPPQVAQTRRQRRQAGLPRDQKQPRLEQQLEPLGRPGPGQADGPSVGGGRLQPPCASDAPKSPPRGRPSSHPRRQRLPLLPGDEDDRDLPPDPVIRGQLLRHSPAVAENPGRDAGARVPLPPDNPAPGLHDRVPREASPRRGAGQQGSFPEGRLAPGGRDEPALLDVLQMGPGSEGGDHRHEPHPHHPCSGSGQRCAAREAPEQLQLGPQVQGHAPAGGDLRLQHPHLLDDGGHQGTGSRPAVCHDAPPHRLQRDPPDVHPHRQGAPAPPAIGAGAVTRGPDASSGNPASGQTLEHATAAGAGEDGGLRPHPVFLKNPHNVCCHRHRIVVGRRQKPAIHLRCLRPGFP